MAHARGEKSSNVKLTENDVLLIRELNRERERLVLEVRKLSVREIARKFDVSEHCIYSVTSYANWIHVK